MITIPIKKSFQSDLPSKPLIFPKGTCPDCLFQTQTCCVNST